MHETDTRTEEKSLAELRKELGRLQAENQRLREHEEKTTRYIRQKVNQLLSVIGTMPLDPDELDDQTLLQLDPIGIVSDTFQHILEHHRETNHALEVARDDIRAIVDSVGEGVMVLNNRGEIQTYNRKMTPLFVAPESEITGQTCRQAVCDGATGEEACLFNQVMKRRKSVRTRSWECRGRFYDVIGTPIVDTGGEIVRVVLLYMDVTRRRKSEQALQESEDRFRDLFENATDMLQSIDPQGRILVVNRAWRETLGYSEEEATALNMFDIIHPDFHEVCRKKFEQILRDGREFTSNAIFLSKTGRKIHVEGRVNCKFVDNKPVALRSAFRDIAQRRRLEEEIRRTQKLESVGLLAGGIAHDFNNLLTGIIGNILLAKLKSPNREVLELLQNTEKASYRAQELTRQLLTFAKGGSPVKETASVLDIIQEVVPFVLSGSKSTWRLETEGEIPPVDVDTGQFSQVLQNLIINCDQAMPGGGTLTIGVAVHSLEHDTIPPLEPGDYVRIDIRDQGIGIAREYLSRVFDPYFTTKKKGSGLGLATAYSIIRNHNGLMTVDSEPGQGTTMTVFLPVSSHTISVPQPDSRSAPRGSGRILIMDDDDIVREVAAQMLGHLGYETGEAADGEEAVQEYQQAMESGRPYDGVILDLTVPGRMGGKETIARLREIDPDVRAIVSSGYCNDPIMAEYKAHGFAGVVPKPYSMEKLGATVQATLQPPPKPE